MILRQTLHKARTSDVHGFLPQELLSFALPARRCRELVWTRKNGDYTFTVNAGALTHKDGSVTSELPSGKYARAAILFLCTQAKLTGEPTVVITSSYRSFIRDLGMEWQGITRSREAVRQLMLVAAATFTVAFTGTNRSTAEEHYKDHGARFSESMELWTLLDRAEISVTSESSITLSPMLMKMMDNAAPISIQAWRWLLANSKSPMALDVYVWLCGRLHRCDNHARVSWQQLYDQFGSTAPIPRFKQHFRAALQIAQMVYPEAQIKEDLGLSRTKGFKGFHLSPSLDPRDAKLPTQI